MRNFKLILAYDGSDFHGWQIQPGLLTIQGTLIEVLERITRQRIEVYGAGRTDAGVHAVGQVANFKTESELGAGDFQRACNALLPPSVRVVAAEEVSGEFHARWDAVGKTYRYRIYRGCVVPPFLWRYVQHDTSALDFAAMEEAACLFEGEHDFGTFAASTGSEEDDLEREMTRTIFRSRLYKIESVAGGDVEWVYEVRGRSFLRYMVRKIVGTLVEVGRGRLRAADVAELFLMRDRARSGATMPPQGLCLISVEYPEVEARCDGCAGFGE